MISERMEERKREGREEKKKGGREKESQEKSWWTETERERAERKHYQRPTLSLSLTLLSLERRDPTQAGLNWAGLDDGRGAGRGRA